MKVQGLALPHYHIQSRTHNMPAIEIVTYNPIWPSLFEKEKARLLSVAGSYIADIQHMGSTSIPGLAAKTAFITSILTKAGFRAS
ncbi:MAG: hypothetical protein NVS4B7_14380 [Ktedonobacteraceae bacterium]